MQPLAPDTRAAYLRRLAVDAAPTEPPGSRTIAELQRAHLLAVPFENLDIHLGRPIVLDPTAIHTKVVDGRRGGYCYELNSQFGRLLLSEGHRVTLVAAAVADADGEFRHPFDHLALVVRAADGTGPHLVDVGFGDAFTEPLPLVDGAERDDRSKRVRLRRQGGAWLYEEDKGDGWSPSYRFTSRPRHLADFAPRNEWQQTSPDSHFTRGTICTRLTPTGRLTLAGRQLISTELADGRPRRTEREVAWWEVPGILAAEFGVVLPAPLPEPVGR